MKKSYVIILLSLFSSLTGYSQKTYSEKQIIEISEYIYSLEKRDSTINIMLLQINNNEIASQPDAVSKVSKLIEVYNQQVAEISELKKKCDCDSLLAALEAKYLALMSKDVITDSKESKASDKSADSAVANLKYGVQIGAYRFPKSFSNKLNAKPLGDVEKSNLGDGITRFIIGGFSSLEQAYEFRKRMIEKGISDAFTVGIYKGKRMLISELRKQSLIPPLP